MDFFNSYSANEIWLENIVCFLAAAYILNAFQTAFDHGSKHYDVP